MYQYLLSIIRTIKKKNSVVLTHQNVTFSGEIIAVHLQGGTFIDFHFQDLGLI